MANRHAVVAAEVQNKSDLSGSGVSERLKMPGWRRLFGKNTAVSGVGTPETTHLKMMLESLHPSSRLEDGDSDPLLAQMLATLSDGLPAN